MGADVRAAFARFVLFLSLTAVSGCGGSNRAAPETKPPAVEEVVVAPARVTTTPDAMSALTARVDVSQLAPGTLVSFVDEARSVGPVAPVLGAARVVSAGGRHRALILSTSPSSGALSAAGVELVSLTGAVSVGGRSVATVSSGGGSSANIDRGREQLVSPGDIYLLGANGDSRAVFEVIDVQDGSAQISRIAGKRSVRPGDRVVHAGNIPRSEEAPRVLVRLGSSQDVDADAIARSLAYGGLDDARVALDAREREPGVPCTMGRELHEALDDGRETDGTPVLAIDVTATASGGVAVGWVPLPPPRAQVHETDVLGRCIETTDEGLDHIVRLAALAAQDRWATVYLHSAEALASEDSPQGVDGVAALMGVRALLELGRPERALTLLQAIDVEESQAAATLALYRAERAFELGQHEASMQLAKRAEGVPAALELSRTILLASLQLSSDWQAAETLLATAEHPALRLWHGIVRLMGAPEVDVRDRVFELTAEIGDDLKAWPGATAAALELAAQVALRHEQPEGALVLLDEAAERYRRAGQNFHAASAMLRIAEVESAQRRAVAASDATQAAAGLLASSGLPREAGDVLLGGAKLLDRALAARSVDANQIDGAMRRMADALARARLAYTIAGDAAGVARSWSQLGEVLLRHYTDEGGAAAEAFESGAFYALHAGELELAARSELAAGLALQRIGAPAEDVAVHLESARKLAERTNDEALMDLIEAARVD